MNSSIYDFTVKNIEGEKISLSEYKDKTILIVNVASNCGFTPQYEELEEIYRKLKVKNFEILAFPCNQFGEQEPGNAEEIKNFCKLNYDISFPLFAKIEVNGKNEEPLYTYLKNSLPGLLGTKAIKWNFTKFLIDKNGIPHSRYAPNTSPLEIIEDINKIL